MKRLIAVAAVFLVSVICAQTHAQTDLGGGYTFIYGTRGLQICQGRWVPSADVAKPGVCEGQLQDAAVFNAVSARQTAASLDQALILLNAIDQKLAVGNDATNRLIEATVNTQASIDQLRQSLGESVSRRFEAVPRDLLTNERFREALTGLKDDILRELAARFPAQPAPPAK